jgi:hypothetical protein
MLELADVGRVHANGRRAHPGGGFASVEGGFEDGCSPILAPSRRAA